MSDEKKPEPKAGIYEQGHPGEKIPEPQGVFLDVLNAYLDDPKSDPKMISTIKNLIANVNNSANQCQLLMNALALILCHKFAPLNVRQQDLDNLPKDWEILVIPVDEKMYQVTFRAPTRYGGPLVLPPSARN